LRFHTLIRRRFIAVSLLPVIAACNYGFAGGGLPPNINDVYVTPIENRTTQFALTDPFTQGLLDAVRSRLGVQLASRDNADAEIRAELTRYIDQASNFAGREDVGAEVFQRRVSITARVEIVDLASNEIVWSGTSVNGVGEYAPDTESEEVGQELALENLIQKIIDGAQSQW
jgi:hypothetical protein